MVILFESYGNFSTGKPAYKALISKRSRGTLTLTEKELSFQSEIDKILYQIKVKDIKNFYFTQKFNIRAIELENVHDNTFTFYASVKKEKSYHSSKAFTIDLFHHLTRILLRKDKPIFFEAGGAFWQGKPNIFDWKTNLKKGILILTEDRLSFKPFDQGDIEKLDVMEINSIETLQSNLDDFIKISMYNRNEFSLTLLTKKYGRTIINTKKVIKLLELLNQVKSYKISELKKERKLERKQMKQIKSMLEVSSKIRLDLMRDALEMDEKSFSNKIFDWAKKFNFLIEGDYLIVNPENVDKFLDDLFVMQGSQEKIQCKFCQKLITSDSINCPYCGVKVQF